MDTNADPQLQCIDHATLTPLVRQALGSETVEVIDWQRQQIHGGAQAFSSLYRFSGDARDQGQAIPWSTILKAIRPVPDRDDPSHFGYWKREVLAYQSGLLDDLPGGLAAPRCFGVCEQPGGEFWIWMEDVKDDLGPRWPLKQYGVAARHLGQFNGAYLIGCPIPSDPSLSKGWLRSLLAQPGAAAGIDQLRDSLEHPLVRRVYPPDGAEGFFRLWAEREAFLDALDRLPHAFCHLDAFRRNLFARHSSEGGYQTVAVDWAFAGTGAIGEEIVPLVVATLGFLEVEMEKALELDAIVFDGYLEGLRDAGWRGDRQVVRLGFTAGAALRYGVAYAGTDISSLVDEGQHARWEQVYGRPMEQVAELWEGGYSILLGWAEEARGLLDSL
jgi:hypothetical protein